MLNRMRPVKKVINTIIDVHPGTVTFRIKCSIKDLVRYSKLMLQRKMDSSEITRIGMAENPKSASIDKLIILKKEYLVSPA